MGTPVWGQGVPATSLHSRHLREICAGCPRAVSAWLRLVCTADNSDTTLTAFWVERACVEVLGTELRHAELFSVLVTLQQLHSRTCAL